MITKFGTKFILVVVSVLALWLIWDGVKTHHRIDQINQEAANDDLAQKECFTCCGEDIYLDGIERCISYCTQITQIFDKQANREFIPDTCVYMKVHLRSNTPGGNK